MVVIASGAILQYLDHDAAYPDWAHHLAVPYRRRSSYVRLDKFTVRSLELIGSMNDGGSSLLNVIDRTISPMGARYVEALDGVSP